MQNAGIFKSPQWLLIKLILLWCIISSTDAEVPNNRRLTTSESPVGAPQVAPAMPDLPLPANVPQSRGSWRKHFLRLGSPVELSPTHPPLSSHFSEPLMKRSGLPPSFVGFKDLAPTQSAIGLLPSGLAQPPLSPSVSSKLEPGSIYLIINTSCYCLNHCVFNLMFS